MPLQFPSIEAALERANLYGHGGELTKAEAIYQDILNRDPLNIAAINNLGAILREQGRLREAIDMFRKLASLHPEMIRAHNNLGGALCESGDLEEGFQSFKRCAEVAHAQSKDAPDDDKPHKIIHDKEQRLHLQTLEGIGDLDFHIDQGLRVPGRAVMPGSSASNIQEQWQTTNPQIVVIDNLLTDQALQGLRQFCWNSTIWRQYYKSGYLGAMPEHGLGSPLFGQIAEEMRATYPFILKHHPLLHYWAFKYDSSLKGTAAHADFAAINVNFWITPDDANLDPDHGGLVVWDTRPPSDWNFSRYNADTNATRDFLLQSGAKATTIPYRSNRAVIFDSALFHETDRFHFKEGYLNRRINITMLYGRSGESRR